MIAGDTSTWIALLQGQAGVDVEQLRRALQEGGIQMVPAVLCELVSDPKLPASIAAALARLPQAELSSGYWEKAGQLRAGLIARGRKARLGDALIAQHCLDHDITLLSRDRDFLAFVATAGLKALVNLQS